MINNDNIEDLTSVRVDISEGEIGEREKGEVVGGWMGSRYILKDNRFLPRLLDDVNSRQGHLPQWCSQTISNK